MWRIALLFVVALSITAPVDAKSKQANAYRQDTTLGAQDGQHWEAFSPAERNLIRAHLLGRQSDETRKSYKNLPPGLQKKVARGKELPPGWQKKVAPGESLDYQIYRQGKSLPDELLRRLPPAPIGSEILEIEDKIIRINSATRTILDAFDLTPAR